MGRRVAREHENGYDVRNVISCCFQVVEIPQGRLNALWTYLDCLVVDANCATKLTQVLASAAGEKPLVELCESAGWLSSYGDVKAPACLRRILNFFDAREMILVGTHYKEVLLPLKYSSSWKKKGVCWEYVYGTY